MLGVVVALIAAPLLQVTAQIKAVTAAGVDSVAIADTGTATLTTPAVRGTDSRTTVVQVNITKVSGTVAGTVSLHGSLDGKNFSAITSTTYTATNGNSSFVWVLTGNPVPYYRVTWTGTGTMAARFKALVQPR